MKKFLGVVASIVLLGIGCERNLSVGPIEPDTPSQEQTAEFAASQRQQVLTKQVASLEEKIETLERDLSYSKSTATVTFNGTAWERKEADSWIPSELLEDLPTDWESAEIQRVGELFLVTRHTYVDVPDEAILTSSRAIFSSSASIFDGVLQSYAYYVWTNRAFESNLYGTVQTLLASEMTSIRTIYWTSILAFCTAELVPYEGVVAVSCGGGDNGCFTKEKVNFSLFEDTLEHIGVCSNSCDLGPNDVYKITCST